jgi:sulfate adenylyltransferase
MSQTLTNKLIAPHGGELVLNIASMQEQTELRECANSLPQVQVDSRRLADLEMLANGAYSPLNGFMTRNDYLEVVNEMHLSNGLPWSVPITLAVSTEQAATLSEGSQIALVDAQGTFSPSLTRPNLVSRPCSSITPFFVAPVIPWRQRRPVRMAAIST